MSDDFNRFNVGSTLWTFVDPLEDSSIGIEGTNTPDAQLVVSVPAGVDHSAWTTLDAPQVLQDVDDVDFAVEVKLESPMSERYQEQGIIVKETDSSPNYLRLDFYHDGTNYHVFAGSVENGAGTSIFDTTVTPIDGRLWMRVSRQGDQFDQEYSVDGVTWLAGASFQRPMTVSQVGVFVSNSGDFAPAPGHTARFDYFFDQALPIVPEDGAVVTDQEPPMVFSVASTAASTSVAFDWRTDEAATAELRYGLTPAYELGSVTGPSALVHSLQASGPCVVHLAPLPDRGDGRRR